MTNYEEQLEKVLEQKEVIKEIRTDLKGLQVMHPVADDIEELKARLKLLKTERDTNEDILQMKEALSEAKDRLVLLQEILVGLMDEAEVNKVTAKGKQAVIIPKVKIERAK